MDEQVQKRNDRRWFDLPPLFLTLAICCLLFSFGCNGPNPSGNTDTSTPAGLENGGISGLVYGTNAVPIASAVVEAGGRQAISASSGRYLLFPLSAGDYRLTARATGYQPTIKDGVRILAGQITENVRVDLVTSTASAAADFQIKTVSPLFGTDGDEISIIGTGFGTVPGRVTVNGKDASVTDWNSKNDGLIRIRLPAEVETGPVRVIISGQESHELPAITFFAKPIAIEAKPPTARAGAFVAILGRNFHEVGGFNTVKLNGRTCLVREVRSTREIVVEIPVGAESGLLDVSIQSDIYQLAGISTARVTIPPELVHLSPKRSLPGVPLTIYGRNFGTDRTAVKVQLGAVKTLGPGDLTSFSSTRMTFLAPTTAIVPEGTSVSIRVLINDSPSDTALTWTSYNTALTTISNYGIYEFSTVSNANTLHLAKLDNSSRIAFVNILAGDGSLSLAGSFSYTLTALLGGNTESVPTLPGASILPDRRASLVGFSKALPDRGPEIRAWAREQALAAGLPATPAPDRSSMRFSIADPAPATTSFWMINFASANPNSADNDVLASASLVASSGRVLVYLDLATDTAVTASEAAQAAAWYDAIYATLATGCWDGLSSPPEGNVDAQPRVVLLLTPQINRGVSGNLNVLGYFNPRDKRPELAHSAGTEIIYLWDRLLRTNSSDFQGVIAHELQHMMYYNQKRGTTTTTWIEEGLSVFAQQLVGFGFPQGLPTPVDQVLTYLQAPQKISLNNWPSDAGLGNYGMSYLFIQYLFEQYGGFTAIQALERDSGRKGFDEVTSQVTHTQLQTFFSAWGLALFCDDLGLATTLPGYSSTVHQYRDLDLRKKFAGVTGLSHLTLNEEPVLNRFMAISGHGFDVFQYVGGNGGDLEVSIPAIPVDTNSFRTWVIYYPAPTQ